MLRLTWPVPGQREWSALLLGSALGVLLLAYPGLQLAAVLALVAGVALLLAFFPLAWLLVPLALPFLPNLAFMGLVGAALLSFLLRVLLVGDISLRLPRNPWLYLFLALLGLGAVTSVLPRASLLEFLLHLGGLGLLVLLYSTLTHRERMQRLLLVLFVATTLVAAVGAIGYSVGLPMESGWVDEEAQPEIAARAYAPFGNPNVLAEYLVFMFPFTLVLIWTQEDRRRLGFLGAGALLQLLCLGLTFARTGWIALVAVILVFALLVDRRLLWLGAAGAVAALPLLPRAGVLLGRLVSIFTMEDTSALHRLAVWQDTWNMIGNFWITGVGLGHRAYRMVYHYFALERIRFPFHSHNNYLQLLAETGVFGLLAFLVYLGSVGRSLWRRWQVTEDPFLRSLLGGLLAALTGILVFGFFETVLYLPKIIILFWMIMGMAHAAAELPDRDPGALGGGDEHGGT